MQPLLNTGKATLPLPHEPAFVRKIRLDVASGAYDPNQAMASLFKDANIELDIEGDTSAWLEEGQGACLVGDHRNSLELLPLMAHFGSMSREDLHFMAKPCSYQARIIGSLGIQGWNMILPVIPRSMYISKARQNVADVYWRKVCHAQLPKNADEATFINTESVKTASELLGAGKAVALFPAAGVKDASVKPWQKGVGRILQGVDLEARPEVAIVPFSFDKFSKTRLLVSLTLAAHGIRPKRSVMTMKIGQQGSVEEVVGSDRLDNTSPGEVTELLRKQFVECLADVR